jgi:transcriptional regulator with XRE-family HTH domain
MRMGLTMRDVQSVTTDLSRRCGNRAFRLSISRLSQYEAQGVIPNIYAMYSLAKIYRRPIKDLLRWYGVPL